MFSPSILPQQAVFPICHLAWSTVRPSGVRTASRRSVKEIVTEVKQIDRKPVKGDNTVVLGNLDLSGLLKIKTSPELLSSISRVLPEVSTGHTCWKSSYQSGHTFFENKNGFPESLLQSQLCPGQEKIHRLVHRLLQQVNHPYITSPQIVEGSIFLASRQHACRGLQQTRGFKTKHSRAIGVISPETVEKTAKKTRERTEEKTKSDAEEKTKSDAGKSTKNLADGFSTNFLKIFLWSTVFVLLFLMFSGPGQISSIISRDNYEVSMVNPDIGFSDVKGQNEALEELKDLVMFLQDPERFNEMGAKLPKGVLLVGPPGVGKTLIAKAIAGEAGVPFFYASGSQFDEVFVGVGASRVRNIFKKAKSKAPAVIFIDEIDSLAGKRTANAMQPYANQTINQLLSEMDGFSSSEGVIVLGATNRAEVLDSAVRRPGRFDTQVDIGIPDLEGRTEILELYIKKIKCAPDTDIGRLAKLTTGMTGADLANFVNQAALRAAVDGATEVDASHFDTALDRIRMGLALANRVKLLSHEEKLLTAHHEAGHALVGFFSKSIEKVHKLTILPRSSGSLGHTSFYTEKDVTSLNREQLLGRLDTLLGGRAAEELLVGSGKVTTGASSDCDQASLLAKSMVSRWAMSEKVGLRTLNENDARTLSEEHRKEVDEEIKRMLQESYERAKKTLSVHYKKQKALADALLEHETLTYEEMVQVINGKKIQRVPKSTNSSFLPKLL
ncbi:ATP-dependent zinc metalloprotease YME1 homolog [Lingula anatina]|uniref:ATP-dependent zinc metalloprotease YME1 homolog n=1 Tax=Lingula anatina TaxID=7574 RepID=A0A1S3I8D8_LINAN|nr:ATP-dependent zinc metalloprotease YME1 homolog [Lingula anatina]|eukprot:XP_013394522.1 ATP-dependent zinc metalloprotease YME1 homolog [Lingula anatina]